MTSRFRLEYSNYSANNMTNGVSYFDTLQEAKADAENHHHYRIVDTKVNAEVLLGGKSPETEHIDAEAEITPAEVVVEDEAPKKSKKKTK